MSFGFGGGAGLKALLKKHEAKTKRIIRRHQMVETEMENLRRLFRSVGDDDLEPDEWLRLNLRMESLEQRRMKIRRDYRDHTGRLMSQDNM